MLLHSYFFSELNFFIIEVDLVVRFVQIFNRIDASLESMSYVTKQIVFYQFSYSFRVIYKKLVPRIRKHVQLRLSTLIMLVTAHDLASATRVHPVNVSIDD